MKSKFLRILALILVMSSLISMFAIFAHAEEAATEEGETEETEEAFKLLYYRTFDEGWDIGNGVQKNFGNSETSTKFEISSQTDDITGVSNYFWLMELNGGKANDYVQFNLNANQNVGTVFEFDVMSDDECNFNSLIHVAAKRTTDNYARIDMLKIQDNKAYLCGKEAFTVSENWTRVRIIFDYTYADPNASEEDQAKQFLMYVYYGSPDGSELTLLNGEPQVITNPDGKGVQYFRFQTNAGDEGKTSVVAFDNIKIYDGVNHVVDITEDMGRGTLINEDYPITVDVENNTGSDENTVVDLNYVLSMKVGVDYCYINKVKSPIFTADDGTVYGAPVKVNGEVMIPINKVLNYTGLPYYVREDGIHVDIANDNGASYITVGEKTATVSGETLTLNAAPAYVTTTEGGKEYSYIAIALSDVATIFPGFYGDYDDMGYIAVSKYEDAIDRNKNLAGMIEVMKKFVFEPFTADEIYEDVEAYTGFDHPYILANGEQLDALAAEYADLDAKMDAGEITEGSEAYWKWVHYQRIVDTGESYYKYYAKPDANGSYDKFVGILTDEEYNNLPENKESGRTRGTTSLNQDYLDSYGYDPAGGRSNIANRTNRLEGMAFAYVLTKDVKYLQLCYEIAMILGTWTHWGPGHFLNCADSSNDFAIYYDWTYDGYVELAKQGVKRINEKGEEAGEYDVSALANILAEQGVHEGYYSTINQTSEHLSPIVGTAGGHYTERTNNWAAVCVGGMTVASLAILGDVNEQYTYEAKYILSENFKSLIAMGLDIYAPDGSYVEGPSYWSYGTNSFFRMCAALDSAAGTNYGLMDCWGMDTTCYYACHTEDNDSHFFNYHDGNAGSQDSSYFFYVASYYNDATLYEARLNQINGNVKSATMIDLIYYPTKAIAGDDVQLDYYSEGIDLFATRSSWERGALYASMIGGANKVSHGQIDAGAFVYHNGGTVWFRDIGTENYNTPGFWPDATRYRYYVMKPEGNNTIAITTDPAGVPYGQTLDGVAGAYKSGSNEHGSYVVYDMGSTLGEKVTKWERGMLLTNDRKTTVIQDQISWSGFQSVYWFAHYAVGTGVGYVSDVDISSDGRTAYMESYKGTDANGEKIYQTLRLTLLSSNKSLKFQLMDCYTFVHTTGQEATYTPEKVLELIQNNKGVGETEKSRAGFKKLAIPCVDGTNFEVSVVIEMIDTDSVGTKRELEVGYEYTDMYEWEPYADTRGLEVNTGDSVEKRGVPNVNLHIVQTYNKVKSMDADGTLYTSKVKEFYRAITDAYYAERRLGSDMPSGYEEQLATLKQYREEFVKYRNAITNLQKTQLDFTYKLMGLS